MKELSLLQIITSAFSAILSSKVLVLIVLELMVLLSYFMFNKLINKRIVNWTCLIVSLVLVTFYGLNYVNTLIIFFNNVSTKLVEMIYFPTTLEFMVVMISSFAIMIATLINKKSNKGLKIVNVVLPVIISFLFLSIIENVNTTGIEFTEYSVFTNRTLMSLHELAMGLFVAWVVGLCLYKIDTILINKAIKEVEDKEYNYLSVKSLFVEQINQESSLEDLEMPKLKGQI